MTTDIEKRVERPVHQLIDPASGETIDLNPVAVVALADADKLVEWIDEADPDEVALLLRSLMDFESDSSKPIKQRMKGRLLAELDRLGGAMTRTFGDVKVVGDSKAAAAGAKAVDSTALAKALRRLVKQGVLDKAVLADVFRREVKVSVNRPAVDRLLKIEGPVGEAVAACMVDEARDRKVTVTWSK